MEYLLLCGHHDRNKLLKYPQESTFKFQSYAVTTRKSDLLMGKLLLQVLWILVGSKAFDNTRESHLTTMKMSDYYEEQCWITIGLIQNLCLRKVVRVHCYFCFSLDTNSS